MTGQQAEVRASVSDLTKQGCELKKIHHVLRVLIALVQVAYVEIENSFLRF